MTKQEFSDLLDKQIEAILAKDFQEYAALIDHDEVEDGILRSHHDCWNLGGHYPKSLFATIELGYCASQIEHVNSKKYGVTPSLLATKDFLLKDSKCRLPNFKASNYETVGDFKTHEEMSLYEFSLEELEEFKRRQLAVCRFT